MSAPAPATASPAVSSREARRFRLRMVAKTMTTMLVVGLVPLAIFGGITLKQESDRLRSDAAASLENSATWIAAQVDEWVDKNARVLQEAATLPTFGAMQPEQQIDMLVGIARTYPWMYLVHTLGPDGKDVARSDHKPLASFGDRQYFKDAFHGKELSWETVISRTTGKPCLVLALPIRSSGTIVGVLTAAMAIEDISRIVSWKTGETGFAFLVDEQAKVVAHPSKDYVLKQTRLASHPLISAFQADGQAHLVSFAQPDGARALGHVRPNKFHWGVAVQQSEQELFAPLRRTVSIGLAILGCASLVVALIAWFSSKTLIKPLLAFAHRNREMVNLLGLMEQGFVSMRADGTLAVERSAKATQLLGDHTAGQTLWQAIAPHDPTFAAWLELGWASVVEAAMPIELTLAQLPGKLAIGDRDYRIEYKPTITNDVVGDTLVVITDMTAELARARAEAAERDLLRMIERMARDRAGFGEFVDETDRLVHRIEATAARDLELDTELKRDLHTLKGNSAIYGLTQIADWCHQLEDGAELTARLDRNVVHLLGHGWSDLKAKLERVFGRLQRTGVDVEPEDVDELHAAIARGASLGIVEQIVRTWTLERTRPRLDRFAEQGRGLAARLGKGELTFAVDDHRVRLDAARFRPFWTVFSHVVRNAVDHGIEEPAERIAAGKSAAGHIELTTRREAGVAVVELGDDGRGIDWEALRTRARDAGLACATHDDLVAAMFSDGITTRTSVTETSGRGVGLAALREVCTRLGGTIHVDSERGRGTRFQFRFGLVGRERTPSKLEVGDRRLRTPSGHAGLVTAAEPRA